MKNCKKFKLCYYCKGLHSSVICFQKDAKGDSPKLAEENKQDEKTGSRSTNCYWNFFTGKTLKGENNAVIASESKFEWV